MEQQLTKICKECERELSLNEFRISPHGTRCNVCNECSNAKRNETRQKNRSSELRLFYDADFEGKKPVEVIQIMSRAKKWLESRGYEITLKGKYTVTKEVKF